MKIKIGDNNKISKSNIGYNNSINKGDSVLINILVGLFITIVGGIIVFYLTK